MTGKLFLIFWRSGHLSEMVMTRGLTVWSNRIRESFMFDLLLPNTDQHHSLVSCPPDNDFN